VSEGDAASDVDQAAVKPHLAIDVDGLRGKGLVNSISSRPDAVHPAICSESAVWRSRDDGQGVRKEVFATEIARFKGKYHFAVLTFPMRRSTGTPAAISEPNSIDFSWTLRQPAYRRNVSTTNIQNTASDQTGGNLKPLCILCRAWGGACAQQVVRECRRDGVMGTSGDEPREPRV
jgi:hypothetical protein